MVTKLVETLEYLDDLRWSAETLDSLMTRESYVWKRLLRPYRSI